MKKRKTINVYVPTYRVLDSLRKGRSWDELLLQITSALSAKVNRQDSPLASNPPSQNSQESRHCDKLVFSDKDEPYCAFSPPRTIRLPSLEVCGVCKGVNVGVVKEKESFDRPREGVRDKSVKIEGMTWCPDGGLQVFIDKCVRCRKDTFSIWYSCQMERLKKKGEAVLNGKKESDEEHRNDSGTTISGSAEKTRSTNEEKG